LEHLNIDSSNLDDEEKHGRELLACLKETKSQHSLKVFSWSYDADEQNDLIEDLLELLGTRSKFSQLKHIELRETLSGKKKRNELRSDFREKNIKLVLSDR